MEILPSGLPKLVDDEEDLARFLTSRSEFNTIMVKPSAFLPNPKDGKKSVFRHGSEPLEGLRQIARENLPVECTLHGIAICKARNIRAANLEVISEEPPSRHADIVGWPWMTGDPEMEKSRQKMLAAEIAQNAALIRF